MKKEKHSVEKKFLDLKTKFKAGELTIEQIDQMTCKLIVDLTALTLNGFTEINGTPLDLYKDRVWWIIEKAGLLPEYKEPEEDLSDLLIEDDYYDDKDEFEFEIDDNEFYK